MVGSIVLITEIGALGVLLAVTERLLNRLNGIYWYRFLLVVSVMRVLNELIVTVLPLITS